VPGGRFEVDATVPIAGPAREWHAALARACKAAGYALIVSLSYELFAEHAPTAWAQRTADGAPARTGYTPPSTLLSPCHAGAMAWLRAVAAAFVALVHGQSVACGFQVGEPWWWVGTDHAPCFYDAATRAAWQGTGSGPMPDIRDIRGSKTAAENALLEWLGARLAQSTLALRDAATAAVPGCRTHLLFYAPQVLDAASPELHRANLPAGWAWPAFDVLQLEDYDFVTRSDAAGMARGRAAVGQALGYPLAQQHYLAGFVATPADRLAHWPLIMAAAQAALARDVAAVFIWAWPQIARDGLTALPAVLESAMPAFHDVLFPLPPGFGAVGGPEFSTQVALMASGFEQRNSNWADARLRFDAGPGVRSQADLATLLAFFRARRGQAHAFRFHDPLDGDSAAAGAAISPRDQPLGSGDGVQTVFALAKHYGSAPDAQVRRITRPVAGSIRIAIDGTLATAGWTAGEAGTIVFATAPPPGARLTAGFAFDVPVRFATDRIDFALTGFAAGELPSVPLIEVREGT
jgi:uncharacterized protein (TIGR02217 family)